jgi:ABC-2 type transport system ATP-binding protein
MIITKNLTKVFTKRIGFRKKEKITAVDHVNLEIRHGEIFGLIGPTGAGKTTIIKILSTLILPDEGTATINGHDVVKDAELVKNDIGVVAGEFTRALYWRLSCRQNLKFFANLKNMWNADARIDELLRLFNLKKWENELVMKFSTGMKHKLALAVALLKDPPILFLDEPLTGIDPITAHEIKTFIKEESTDKTILWTSHNLYEIEEMCDRIALINEGKIVLRGSPTGLRKGYWGHEKITIVSDDTDAFANIRNMKVKGDTLEIKTKNVTKTLFDIIRIVKKKKVKIKDIKIEKPTLEEIFLKNVKKCTTK